MNLILHLTPELEAILRERATTLGRPLEDFALEALKENLQSDAGEFLPKEHRLTKFHELIASMPDGNPEADLSRDSAYGNRGE